MLGGAEASEASQVGEASEASEPTCRYYIRLALILASLHTTIPATLGQYTLLPAPNGVTLSGGCVISSGRLICPANSAPPLTDGDTTLNVMKIYTWNQGSSVLAGFTLHPATLVTGANIFFQNKPSQGIGLPSIGAMYDYGSIFAPETPLENTVIGNQDLSQGDSGLRNVSLVVTAYQFDIQPYPYFFIEFTFSDSSPITTLVLSEIELCTIEGELITVCLKCLK